MIGPQGGFSIPDGGNHRVRSRWSRCIHCKRISTNFDCRSEYALIFVSGPISYIRFIVKVQTIAIERVYIYNNTSVVQDEVLCHRLGLVPLRIDPRIIEEAPTDYQNLSTDRNTVVFTLDAQCYEREGVKPGETDPEKLYVNSNGKKGHSNKQLDLII